MTPDPTEPTEGLDLEPWDGPAIAEVEAVHPAEEPSRPTDRPTPAVTVHPDQPADRPSEERPWHRP